MYTYPILIATIFLTFENWGLPKSKMSDFVIDNLRQNDQKTVLACLNGAHVVVEPVKPIK